jgi:hypothetical protein
VTDRVKAVRRGVCLTVGTSSCSSGPSDTSPARIAIRKQTTRSFEDEDEDENDYERTLLAPRF